ncbi:unnamed protein product, partial [Rotaria sp. Silwood1]
MMKSHEIALVILEALSLKLGLDSRVLPNLHRLKQPSGDQLRLTKSTMYPTEKGCLPAVAFGAHTDFGSNGEWLDIQPLPGHAIVNLGDAMVKLSGGILKSNIHRIVTISGLKET